MGVAMDHVLETDLGPTADRVGAGEGRDRAVKPGLRRFVKPLLAMLGLVGLLGALLWIWDPAGFGTLEVSRAAVTVAPVESRLLQETVSGTGTVIPRETVYLDLEQGGRIEGVFVREGARVEAGQPLVKLANSDLELRLLNADVQRLAQLNELRESRSRLDQAALERERELADLDHEIRRLERDLERKRALFEEQLIPRQQYEDVQDELAHFKRRRTLTLQAARQEEARRKAEIEQLEASARTMEQSFDVIRRSERRLLVRAPATGQLTSFAAQVGQLLEPGARLGQVSILSAGHMVRAGLDEYYADRIVTGQEVVARIGEESYPLRVARVYPEVREGEFEMDLEFLEHEPRGLRRGQTVGFQLHLGGADEVLTIPRGNFFQDTAGHWIYVLEGDGRALRREIRLGRRGAESFEVLEGLRSGERVLISSYEAFDGAERLTLE